MDQSDTIFLHQGDLPTSIQFADSVAVDTETMGLQPGRDRLCLVQLSAGDGICHIVQIPPYANGPHHAPNLAKWLTDPALLKIFHFARFDIAALKAGLGIDCTPIYCTKTASRLCRTFTDRHGLKDICRELLGVEISKQQQLSDWGNPELKPEQLKYAASDVLYLHRLKGELDRLLARERRQELAAACFAFLPARAVLDLAGWAEVDIFAH